ncbi:MAG: modulator of FtsH protease HflC [Deferribacteres bacterium]|jgi:membrane protease subunit HflC|nr:hflC [Deferribacteraceae bacterium]MDK2791878.1 modulator of FtsH protease HflC [Deferribacteres bacterium]
MKKLLAGIIIVVVLLVAAPFTGAFFVVKVNEQAIVTYLGKVVRVIKEPGLYFKIPFIYSVSYLSKMLLEYDAPVSEILTKDKKNLVLDNYCRWKIDDPLKFYLSVRDVYGAMSRIDDIIYSEMRIELGQHTLTEVVSVTRNEIMANVTKAAREKAKVYGIYIQDIRIKRADLPPENERAVYERMRAERIRIAKQYRSEGLEEAQKIKAKTEKEKKIILAEAYKKVQEIKGETDAKVVKIYADAFKQDPNFYEFIKTLEVYSEVFTDNSKYFLSTNSKLLRLLNKGDIQ